MMLCLLRELNCYVKIVRGKGGKQFLLAFKTMRIKKEVPDVNIFLLRQFSIPYLVIIHVCIQ